MMTEEGFWQAMRDNPHEAALAAVFADWLEERGVDGLAELLRLRHTLTQTAAGPDRPEREARLRELVVSGMPLGVVRCENALGMSLTLIPPGRFLMGSPETEPARLANEGPQREVAITRGFYLGVHPVTQAQFHSLMGHNPAFFHDDNGGGPTHPVEAVTWTEAVEFCRRLSALPEEKAAGRVYRLPTEAEWEYACRAGTTSPFFFGEKLAAAQANYRLGYPGHVALPDGRSVEYAPRRGPDGLPLEKTSPVGSYPPNAWGLYDLHGNVWEWCADCYDPAWHRMAPAADPINARGTRPRSIRGGAWREPAWKCRSACREGWPLPPEDPAVSRSYDLGFRVACDAVGVR